MKKTYGAKISLLAVLLAIACFASLAVCTVAYADDEASLLSADETTGVEVGEGVVLTRQVDFNQTDVKASVITAIQGIRSEAWSGQDVEGTKNITFYGAPFATEGAAHNMTMKGICEAMGMSRTEYVSGWKWSNALERIAMQRATEAGDSTVGKDKRPNGTDVSTATYKGISADHELIKWSNNSYDFNAGNNFIAKIKQQQSRWIAYANGDGSIKESEYSDYLDIVNPYYTTLGACVVKGINKAYVGVIEFGKTYNAKKDRVNGMELNGIYPVDVADGKDANSIIDPNKTHVIDFCMDVTGCYRMNIGNSYNFKATVETDGKTTEVTTGFSSSDSKILKFDGTGKATALKAGTVTVYLGGKNGIRVRTVTVPENTEMYRLYNPYTGEHFYTSDAHERDHVTSVGWNFEGIGWVGLRTDGKPLYRLYNPYSGEHFYTINEQEKNNLVKVGWNYEGVTCNSADKGTGMGVYRLYNPYVPGNNPGSHHYTTSKQEYEWLITKGWRGEGQAWEGVWYSI